jgi:hypothetical protein
VFPTPPSILNLIRASHASVRHVWLSKDVTILYTDLLETLNQFRLRDKCGVIGKGSDWAFVITVWKPNGNASQRRELS